MQINNAGQNWFLVGVTITVWSNICGNVFSEHVCWSLEHDSAWCAHEICLGVLLEVQSNEVGISPSSISNENFMFFFYVLKIVDVDTTTTSLDQSSAVPHWWWQAPLGFLCVSSIPRLLLNIAASLVTLIEDRTSLPKIELRLMVEDIRNLNTLTRKE